MILQPDRWRVLIDGDTMVYRCAFSAEKRMYRLMNGAETVFSASTKRDIKKWLEEYTGPTLTEEKDEWAEPVSFALKATRTVLDHVLERLNPRDWYQIFISTPDVDDFRAHVATIKKYKGNRDNQPKPKYYADVRDYLVEQWKAVQVLGIEADDQLGLEQEPDGNTIIVSNDKDLYQIPGWHFNWTEENPEPFYIFPHEAERWLCIQLLAGDSVDNIEGLPGVGVKTAAKMLQNVEDEFLLETTKELFLDKLHSNERVKGWFKGTYTDYVASVGKTPEEIWEETYSLIKILRTEEELDAIEAAIA